jgi:hypothetical protein
MMRTSVTDSPLVVPTQTPSAGSEERIAASSLEFGGSLERRAVRRACWSLEEGKSFQVMRESHGDMADLLDPSGKPEAWVADNRAPAEGPMNCLSVAFLLVELELEFGLLGWLIWRLI